MKNLILVLSMLFSCLVFAEPTAVTPVSITEAGYELSLSSVDATNGNSVLNTDGDIILYFYNNGTPASTPTVEVQNSSVTLPGYGPVTKTDVTCSLLGSEMCIIGPLPTRFYNDGNGKIQLTFTGAGSGNVDMLAFKAKRP